MMNRLGFRVGAILAMVLIVAAVVVVGRAVGGRGAQPTHYSGAETASLPSSISPGAGDDGVVSTPSAGAGADQAAVRTLVDEFIAAWLDRNLSAATWHAGVAKFATTTLAQSLVGVDPLSVPATRVAGDVTFPILSSSFGQAVVPVDSGTVTLTVLKRNGHWLVDGVDWERA